MTENTDNNNNVALETSNVVSATQTIFAKPFLDVSKIEVFIGQNFRRWQECVSTLLESDVVMVDGGGRDSEGGGGRGAPPRRHCWSE